MVARAASLERRGGVGGSHLRRGWGDAQGPGVCLRGWAGLTLFFSGAKFRTSSTTTRDRNLQFRGAVSTGGSPLDFLIFLQYLCAS